MSNPPDNANGGTTEAFPPLSRETTPQFPETPSTTNSIASYIPAVIRKGTIRLLQADVPRGTSLMTAQTWAEAPTLSEVRQGAYTTDGEERWRQFESTDTPADFRTRRATFANRERKSSTASKTQAFATSQEAGDSTDVTKAPALVTRETEESFPSSLTRNPTILDSDLVITHSGTYPNGYKFPPKHTWTEATSIGFRAFLNFTFRTWFGFFLTLYGVLVVGWGGMIFLLLCGAGNSRMCWLQSPPHSGHYVTDCTSMHTSKSFWIEVDAQVLTALFCLPAFGLFPWRARDAWHICQYRIWHEHLALRKLAAAHKGWFRLPDSHHLDPLVDAADLPIDNPEAQALVPYPPRRAARRPLTGARALPTMLWKMDFVVWMMFANTMFQVVLCGVMWGLNRFDRPAWTTAVFIVGGMLSGIFAGWIQFTEGKKIKKREGVALKVPTVDRDIEKEAEEGAWGSRRESLAAKEQDKA